jgi:hypothetical protein
MEERKMIKYKLFLILFVCLIISLVSNSFGYSTDDFDGDGISDDLEKHLAEKFSPVLYKTAGEKSEDLADFDNIWLHHTSARFYTIRGRTGGKLRPPIDEIIGGSCPYGRKNANSWSLWTADIDDDIRHRGAVDGARPLYYHVYKDGLNFYIQYWYFFTLSDLTDENGTWHEADWEHVTIWVTENGASYEPVLINFYQHAGGISVKPSDAWWSENKSGKGLDKGFTESRTHLNIWVASNSHTPYNRFAPTFNSRAFIEVKRDILPWWWPHDEHRVNYSERVDYHSLDATFPYDLLVNMGEIILSEWAHNRQWYEHYEQKSAKDSPQLLGLAFLGEFNSSSFNDLIGGIIADPFFSPPLEQISSIEDIVDWFNNLIEYHEALTCISLTKSSQKMPFFASLNHEWHSFSIEVHRNGFGNESKVCEADQVRVLTDVIWSDNTFYVTNTDIENFDEICDDDCSLRDAVTNANRIPFSTIFLPGRLARHSDQPAKAPIYIFSNMAVIGSGSGTPGSRDRSSIFDDNGENEIFRIGESRLGEIDKEIAVEFENFDMYAGVNYIRKKEAIINKKKSHLKLNNFHMQYFKRGITNEGQITARDTNFYGNNEGVANVGTANFNNCTFRRNGLAINNSLWGETKINNSLIYNNSMGVLNNTGAIEIQNSTLANNVISLIKVDSNDIDFNKNIFKVFHSTVAFDEILKDPKPMIVGPPGIFPVFSWNSIFFKKDGNICGHSYLPLIFDPPLNIERSSIFSDSSCGSFGNQSIMIKDPLLQPFQESLIPGRGHLPLSPKSPAIDAAGYSLDFPLFHSISWRRDQLGNIRIDSNGYEDENNEIDSDIGAAEYGVVNDLYPIGDDMVSFNVVKRYPLLPADHNFNCPSSANAAVFSFMTRLTNNSLATFSNLVVRVEALTPNNMLLRIPLGPSSPSEWPDPVGVGGTYDLLKQFSGYQDGVLVPGESSKFPFAICLSSIDSFEFWVSLWGK